MEGDNVGKKGRGHGGTCVKELWTKPKRGRIKGERWEWAGRGERWEENGYNCN